RGLRRLGMPAAQASLRGEDRRAAGEHAKPGEPRSEEREPERADPQAALHERRRLHPSTARGALARALPDRDRATLGALRLAHSSTHTRRARAENAVARPPSSPNRTLVISSVTATRVGSPVTRSTTNTPAEGAPVTTRA